MLELLTACLGVLAPQQPQSVEDPIEALQGTARPEPLPIPRSAVLRRGDRKIVVDGSLQDWPALPPIGLDDVRQVSGTAHGAFRSLDDLAGRVFLMWDGDDLYVAARVLDDWHIRLKADAPRVSEIPPADSLLLTFDPLRDSRSYGVDPGRSEDAEFWLAEVEGQERLVVRWDRLRGAARFAEGATAVVTHDDDNRTTTYEARIPWREILPAGRGAAAGTVLDLQLVLNDYDEPTDLMPQTRAGWSFGMGPRIDPWLLGSIVLSDTAADDVGAGGVQVPDIAPPKEPDTPPVPDEAYWIGLKARLDRVGAAGAIVDRDTVDASFAGGEERRDVLLELDRRLAAFPRVDFLEFQQRIHRRMNRECAGIVARGLPYFWEHALEALVRRVAVDPPETGFRIHRLPQGGWLVRSRQASFAIDPAGYGIDHRLFDWIDFVLLTRPLEVARRNDQLLLRMTAAQPRRKVFTHVAVHLPGVDVREFPLVVPGLGYDVQGLAVRVFGERDEEGFVSRSVGYQVSWPDGTDLVVSGVEMRSEDPVPNGGLECLLLSTRRDDAVVVGQRVAAGITILDDAFECSAYPGRYARVDLADVWRIQDGMRPNASVLIAPGDALEVPLRAVDDSADLRAHAIEETGRQAAQIAPTAVERRRHPPESRIIG